MAMYTEIKVKGFGGVLQPNSSNERDVLFLLAWVGWSYILEMSILHTAA